MQHDCDVNNIRRQNYVNSKKMNYLINQTYDITISEAWVYKRNAWQVLKRVKVGQLLLPTVRLQINNALNWTIKKEQQKPSYLF